MRFAGTGGTVLLSSASTLANSLEFTSDGYTLQSSSTTTRTITNASGNVTVGSGLRATFGNYFKLDGTNGFTKLGDGTLVLGSTTNTYSGVTSINAGVVKLGVNQGLNNAALSVASAATLDLAGFKHVVGSGALSGSGTITSSSAGGVLSFESTTSSDFSGVLSGSLSLAKAGGTDSTLTLSGSTANTYSGDTTVSIGNLTLNKSAGVNAVGGNLIIGDGGGTTRTLSLSAANQIADTSIVTLSNSGRFNLNGNSETIGALTGGVAGVGHISLLGATLTIAGTAEGNFAGNIALGTSGVLAVGGASNATISGVISSSTGSLVKSGSGTLILSGTNTYGGATTISNGTLQIGNGTDAGSIGSTSAITNNGALVYNVGSGTRTNGAVISGNGMLTQNSSGGTLILTGTNTYSGATVISAGTLQIGNGGTTGSIASTSGVTNNGTLAYNRSDNLSAAYAISGGGNVTKSGAGTLTLSGANSYTGGTLVSTGTLQGDSTSLQGAITNNAAVIFANATNGTYAGAMSGTGAVAKTGAGTLILSGNSSYSGATTISNGTLQIGNGGTTGSIASTSGVNNGGTLAYNRSDNLSAAYAISGGGNVTKSGAGTLTLSGANSYSGGTLVSTGTLQGDSTSLQGAITNNAAVIFTQTLSGTYAGALSGSGYLTKSGSGTLTISASNSYSGGTRLDGGKLVAGNASAFGTGGIAVGTGTALDLSGYTVLNSITNNGGTVSSSGTLSDVTASNGTTSLAGNNSTVSSISGSATVNVTGSGTSVGAMSGGVLNVNGSGTVLTNYNGGDIGISNSRTLTIRDGASSGAISGAGGVVKAGSGTLTLSANNTYTGATTVEAGKLVVNGTNASATTVQTGASLGGGGTLASATIQSGATISPGNSPGTLTLTNGLTLDGGGKYDWEIFGVAGTPGQTTAWDWINVSGGGLTLAGLSAENKFEINVISLSGLPSTQGLLAGFDNTQSYSWTILSSSNGLAGLNTGYFNINYAPFAAFNNLGAGTFSLVVSGNDLNLLFSGNGPQPVPEPGTWAAAALLAGAATFLRWRRTSSARQTAKVPADPAI